MRNHLHHRYYIVVGTMCLIASASAADVRARCPASRHVERALGATPLSWTSNITHARQAIYSIGRASRRKAVDDQEHHAPRHGCALGPVGPVRTPDYDRLNGTTRMPSKNVHAIVAPVVNIRDDVTPTLHGCEEVVVAGPTCTPTVGVNEQHPAGRPHSTSNDALRLSSSLQLRKYLSRLESRTAEGLSQCLP